MRGNTHERRQALFILPAAQKENHMKMAIAVFAFFIAVSTAQADGMTDSHATTDSMSTAVNVGKGEVFTCSDVDFISCVDPVGFICYGWSNCDAIGAIGAAPALADPLDGGSPATLFTPLAPIATPEPASVLLLASGLLALMFRKR
jgi:hypothetical protein